MYLNPGEFLAVLVKYSLNGRIEFKEEKERGLDSRVKDEFESLYVDLKETKENGVRALKVLYEENKAPKIKYSERDYYFVPPEVTIVRASKETLGPGVLGVAYPGLKLIMVLDSLYGKDKSEVLAHEGQHIVSPLESEKDIRGWTKFKLSYARYQ